MRAQARARLHYVLPGETVYVVVPRSGGDSEGGAEPDVPKVSQGGSWYGRLWETVQSADTSDLVFDPVALVTYVSQIVTLNPGDVIATGTPGGVGHARKPPRYLTDGAELVTRVEGVGECRNICRLEAAL